MTANSRKKKKEDRSSPPWKDYPQSLHPKHLIFLSIDAIGSTRLKTAFQEAFPNDPGKAAVWAGMLLSFLPETPTLLWKNFQEQLKECPVGGCTENCMASDSKNPHFSAWKYIGDEVVMVADLHCPKHPLFFIQAMRATLADLNKKFSKKKLPPEIEKKGKDLQLQFKGAAWVAGFPVANMEVRLPGVTERQGDEAFMVKDYLGPSIDLGFRIGKYASKSRLAISASLAFFLLLGKGSSAQQLPLYSSGKVYIKGALKDAHHLFWVPVGEGDDPELIHKPDDSELRNFFDKLYSKNKPFILCESAEYDPDTYFPKYRNAVIAQQKLVQSPFRDIPKKTNAQQTNEQQTTNEILQDLIEKAQNKESLYEIVS